MKGYLKKYARPTWSVYSTALSVKRTRWTTCRRNITLLKCTLMTCRSTNNSCSRKSRKYSFRRTTMTQCSSSWSRSSTNRTTKSRTSLSKYTLSHTVSLLPRRTPKPFHSKKTKKTSLPKMSTRKTRKFRRTTRNYSNCHLTCRNSRGRTFCWSRTCWNKYICSRMSVAHFRKN